MRNLVNKYSRQINRPSRHKDKKNDYSRKEKHKNKKLDS